MSNKSYPQEAIDNTILPRYTYYNDMKYVISDKGEIKIGYGYHADLASDFKGKVVRVGHCEIDENGKYRVFDMSIGYNIKAQPDDADILNTTL